MKKNTLGHLYKDGEIIIKQNTLGNSLYVIQEGKVEVIDENNSMENPFKFEIGKPGIIEGL